jgi:adenylylsulfate kinase
MVKPIQTNSFPVIWFTGLSGAGKTTLAHALGSKLENLGMSVEVLDADKLRQELSADLGYSPQDRDRNVRRISALAKQLSEMGKVVLVACISPYRRLREEVRASHPYFIEVFVNAPLGVCEHRDVKGLYARARAGEISEFTGISSPYEPPLQPEVECRTDIESVEACCEKVFRVMSLAERWKAQPA